MQDLLAGKNFVIMGVAIERSIAYAIAQSLHQAGARLVVTYQNEKLEHRVRKLCSQLRLKLPYVIWPKNWANKIYV